MLLESSGKERVAREWVGKADRRMRKKQGGNWQGGGGGGGEGGGDLNDLVQW